MKKITLRVLSLALVLCMVFALAACTDDEGGNNNGTMDENLGTVEEGDNYEYAKSLIPDVNYEGYEFRILCMNSSSTYDSYKSRNVIATENLSIPVNDEVFARNQYLESKLNIKIKGVDNFDDYTIKDEIQAAVTSGDDRYDIVFAPMRHLADLSAAGCFLDLKSVEELNLEGPWWDQGAVRDLTIGGKLYFCASDGDILDKQTTWGTMFNKKLCVDNSLEYPYQLVRDGEWTADKYIEYARQVKSDLNGDGEYDENDLWGILTENNSTPGFYFGFNGYITKKNSDDIPEFSMTDAHALSAVDKALEIVLDDDIALKVEDFESPDSTMSNWLYASYMFSNDQVLFRTTDINTVERLRNMEADFGILPMPKLDENQESYTCGSATAVGTAVAIPVTVQDVSKVGTILEAFVSTSRYTLLKGYYDANLQGIITRDDESSEMLDIIFSTRHFDLGYCFDWGGLGYILRDVAADKSNTFVSKYDSVSTVAQKALDETVKKFQALAY